MENAARMKKFAMALTLMTLAAGADPISMQQLMTDKKAQDGKVVTVTGTVKSYYEKDDYSSFLLIDGGKGCSVYVPGRKGLQNEQHITVTGTFSLSKKLGTRMFSNVVEATEVTPAP